MLLLFWQLVALGGWLAELLNLPENAGYLRLGRTKKKLPQCGTAFFLG